MSYREEITCQCGNKIEITVPMFVNDNGDYICKDCFEKIKLSKELIENIEKYIGKLEELMKKKCLKRKINDQIDLTIDDFIELLRELRITKKPLSEEKREYFFSKLNKRQEKLYEITQMAKELKAK